MSRGLLHHVELFVSDLARSRSFWEWFLGELGYEVSAGLTTTPCSSKIRTASRWSWSRRRHEWIVLG